MQPLKTTRAHWVRALCALSLAGAVPGLAVAQAPTAGLDQRLPDPAWFTVAPGVATPVATADAQVDPEIPADDPHRGDAVARVAAAGFVGGVTEDVPADPAAPIRAWAAQFSGPDGARAALDAMRWAARARTGVASQTVTELDDPADGRLVVTVMADGTARTAVMFAAGSWLYGLERVTAPGTPAPTDDLTSLAARLFQRQPERADPLGAQPLAVTQAVKDALTVARGIGAAPAQGSVQAAVYGGTQWAMARFAGVDDPQLFRAPAGGTWTWVGDPGGPGCPRVPEPVRQVWGVAVTCPLGPSPVVRPDDPDALSLDTSPFSGLGSWVWQVSRSGGARGIAATATSHGIRTVFVKSGDGRAYWSQFDRVVGPLKAAGLRVCAWQYVYGRRPVAEARVGARAIAAGADCFVVDAEAEFEGGPNGYGGRTYRAARTYLATLRHLSPPGTRVGLTSFAYVDTHPRFPYSAFLDGPNAVDALLPQVYWRAFRVSVDTALARTARWNSIYQTPITPLAGTYMHEPPTDLTRFRCLAAAYGWQGASYWSFQDTNARQWPLLGGTVTGCTTPPQLARTYPTLRFRRSGDAVVWLQERLQLWGVPVPVTGHYLAQTRAGVRAFQRVRGLEADGVAGPLTWALLLDRPDAGSQNATVS
ncbi:MAG: peptidoglycan-binding protein [Thermoleophilia bacterium]